MASEKVDEACNKETTAQLDVYTAVKELHVLSSKELGKLIRDAENGNIKCTKKDGSSFEINVVDLARQLVIHLFQNLVSSLTVDEQRFRYVLSVVKLLHTLCDVASYQLTLAQVFGEDIEVRGVMLNSILDLIIFLSPLGEKINGSSQMVLLYSTLLSSSMYLLKALFSSEWQVIVDVLHAHPKVNEFRIAAFTAVHVVISFLPVKLPAQRVDSGLKSIVNEYYLIFHLCESSLQFLQSLCKQMIFRERLVENKELCIGDAVLQLVLNTLKLSQCDDPRLMDVVYRLKSKAVSILLLLCEAESSSFVDLASSTPQSKALAESAVSEILKIVKMMFCGDLKDHPRGLLQLDAMTLTEIFSGHSEFRTFIAWNLTQALTQVFSQPQREFLTTWCSYDPEPAEEDTVLDFDPMSTTGLVMALTSTLQVQHSTWNNFQPPQTPYTLQRSSLLVKIIANLTCYIPGLSEDDDALFTNAFLECLQTEYSKLPGGAAERTAAARKNLSSLLAHAVPLTPSYLGEEDVNVLRWFVSELEQPPAAQETDNHRVMEVHNGTRCPSPTPQSPSPYVHDKSGNDDEGVSVNLALVPFDQLTSNENGQNQSNGVVGEDHMSDLSETSGDQNIEPLNSKEKQQKKKKRTIMDDNQIDIIEKTLLKQPVLQRRDGSLQLLAAKLSLHGKDVTPKQLRNWLNNRKAKLARAAAKDTRVQSDGDDALTEKQTGSGPGPSSPESLMDIDYDPSSSVSRRKKDHRRSVLKSCGSKSTQDTTAAPTNSFKRQVGQRVVVKDDQGGEIGRGTIKQTRDLRS